MAFADVSKFQSAKDRVFAIHLEGATENFMLGGAIQSAKSRIFDFSRGTIRF